MSEHDERTARPSRGYVLDDLALVAGLGGASGEHYRRELSRMIHRAAEGGPMLDVPALCLAEATTARRSIAEHVADLVATAPPGAVAVREFVRDAGLDAARTAHTLLDWAGTHAAQRALATGHPIVTLHPERYRELGVEVVPL
ncbi:hypothetical protein GCM10022251_46900 [Phytohabitans flavus]|uniref:PIN domain-containing protein n=1 Tax=Phytohabitans flavus TaxID=1076124 RepID=A0A6F8Y844_9ACTN|nr:hypothetical protein [Phytohabitans flavus]BCB82265.1 hypothetical protein Pflav_086750 [Phytohabitans flavus]